MKEVVKINGKNILIKNNQIWIDGVEYVPKNSNVTEVEFQGKVNKLNADCSFSIKGDVLGDMDIGGSVSIDGNVDGDIDAGGSVNIVGKHSGNIDAGGSVLVNSH